MRRGTLVCSAMPFGYGPAAKLLTLAAGLRRDWRLVFVGQGTALELVSRERGAFDEVVAAHPCDAAARRRISEAWGVLSVMDRGAGDAAARLGTPLFVVDSLLWMRSRVPPALGAARLYFAQHFPETSPERYWPRPVWVGPIVSRPGPAAIARRAGLVIHLGGSAAPDDRRPLYQAYARFVVDAALAAGLAERIGPITVLGGEAAVAALEGRRGDPRVRLASAAHGEARERMARAAVVLTAPGLTATLECFHDGTPTWFLPPQNYSQWCILRRLRAQGAAADALHWEDLEGAPQLADGLPAQERDAVVVAAIGRLTRDRGAGQALRERLARIGGGGPDPVAAQTAFFASLGPSGSETIVSTLRSLRATGARLEPAPITPPA